MKQQPNLTTYTTTTRRAMTYKSHGYSSYVYWVIIILGCKILSMLILDMNAKMFVVYREMLIIQLHTT